MIDRLRRLYEDPEYGPYLRRVAVLIVLAALAGVVLALVVPSGHH